jgi:hypothetical protein
MKVIARSKKNFGPAGCGGNYSKQLPPYNYGAIFVAKILPVPQGKSIGNELYIMNIGKSRFVLKIRT